MSSISAKAYIINPTLESSYSDEISGISKEVEDLYSVAVDSTTVPTIKISSLLNIISKKKINRLEDYMVHGLCETGLISRHENEYSINKENKYINPTQLPKVNPFVNTVIGSN